MNLKLSIHPIIITRLQQIRGWIKRRDTGDRLTGWGIALLFLLFLYLIAALSDVSTGAYATRVLTFTSVVSPPSLSSAPASMVDTATPYITAERSPRVPVREAITLEQTLSRDGMGERRAIQRRAIAGTPQRNSLPRPDLSLDRTRPTPQIRRNTGGLSQRRLPTPGRPALPAAEPPRLRSPVTSGLSLPEQERTVPQERTEIDVPKVRIFDETTLTTEDARTARISEWVRRNPRLLPDVVLRHMDYMDGDFTTYASVSVDGRLVDLYLLVRGAYDQMQVVLVDGDRSFLFFDRGLTKQTSRFRVGSVSRSPEGIARIVSQEREITSTEAQDFYRIFIEWWEATESP